MRRLARAGFFAYGTGVLVWAADDPAWMGQGPLFWCGFWLTAALCAAGAAMVIMSVARPR